MRKTFEQYYKQLTKEAVELWDEKGELTDIEKDPVIKLLFSALAYQSHSISQEISSFQERIITEFRNKLIPYHLIKSFPSLSVIQTEIKKADSDENEPLESFFVDEKSTFEFGKNKMSFSPLFKTKIINAKISDKQIDDNDHSIQLTLSSDVIIEDFSGLSFYFENAPATPEIDITLNNMQLPVIRPDDYDNLPLTDWFQHHYLLREENQLQMGNIDYWQELYLKQNIHLFYINEYNTNKIKNTSNSPVFTIHFKNKSDFGYIRNCNIKINCLPIINVQKNTITLNDNEPIKKLSTDKSMFLNLLIDENTDIIDENYYIRHFGTEKFNSNELLFQLNDLFNRFISDYYTFKSVDELKKGEKLDNLYRIFKELMPAVMKNENNYSGIYAILKLNKNIKYQDVDFNINYLTTNCKLANGIKEGEKPGLITPFLNKESTFLLKETSGGRNEEINEEALNHLARYNLLTKDKLVTSSDLKAFCYMELKNKIRNVTIKNTGDIIEIQIRIKEDFAFDQQERNFYESLLHQKIKVRSLFSLPVSVTIN